MSEPTPDGRAVAQRIIGLGEHYSPPAYLGKEHALAMAPLVLELSEELEVYHRLQKGCRSCQAGKPERVMIDEDGVLCSVSGKKGWWGHTWDDFHWWCADDGAVAENDRLRVEAKESQQIRERNHHAIDLARLAPVRLRTGCDRVDHAMEDVCAEIDELRAEVAKRRKDMAGLADEVLQASGEIDELRAEVIHHRTVAFVIFALDALDKVKPKPRWHVSEEVADAALVWAATLFGEKHEG
jgi:hypothetical protein